MEADVATKEAFKLDASVCDAVSADVRVDTLPSRDDRCLLTSHHGGVECKEVGRASCQVPNGSAPCRLAGCQCGVAICKLVVQRGSRGDECGLAGRLRRLFQQKLRVEGGNIIAQPCHCRVGSPPAGCLSAGIAERCREGSPCVHQGHIQHRRLPPGRVEVVPCCGQCGSGCVQHSSRVVQGARGCSQLVRCGSQIGPRLLQRHVGGLQAAGERRKLRHQSRQLGLQRSPLCGQIGDGCVVRPHVGAVAIEAREEAAAIVHRSVPVEIGCKEYLHPGFAPSGATHVPSAAQLGQGGGGGDCGMLSRSMRLVNKHDIAEINIAHSIRPHRQTWPADSGLQRSATCSPAYGELEAYSCHLRQK